MACDNSNRFERIQSVNTPTSPNTNVVTTPTFDTNNTTTLSFQYQGRIPVWTPQVSQSVQTAELGDSISIGDVTWVNGLRVTYRNLDAKTYTIVLDGKIRDGGTVYNHSGTTLGIFQRADEDRRAEEPDVDLSGLPEATFQVAASVNTPTSPNTNVVTTPTFDTNNTTNLSFQYQGRIPVWTPQVSQSIPQAVLGGNRAIGDTVWEDGMTVRYSNLNATQYVVIFDGTIIDNGTAFRHVGTTLGIFTRRDT
jgi:hypothetical protein